MILQTEDSVISGLFLLDARRAGCMTAYSKEIKVCCRYALKAPKTFLQIEATSSLPLADS